MIGWLILAAVLGAFVYMAWRMSSGPTNEEPAIGHNLPGASTTLPQFGPYPLSPGPELGTPESLESTNPDHALRRAHHREEWEEHRHS